MTARSDQRHGAAAWRNTRPGVRMPGSHRRGKLYVPDEPPFFPPPGQWGLVGFLVLVIVGELSLLAYLVMHR